MNTPRNRQASIVITSWRTKQEGIRRGTRPQSEVDDQVAAYLAKGGKIEQVPTGKTGQNYAMSINEKATANRTVRGL